MKVTFTGVRGSVPRPSTHREILDRILARIGGEKSISLSELKELLDAKPLTYGGNTPSIHIESESQHLIIDAGTGIRYLSEHYNLHPCEPIHLILTHLHWDHIQGLPFFVPIYQKGREINIYSALPQREVQKFLAIQHSAPFFPVDFSILPSDIRFHPIDPKRSRRIGPFTVSSMQLIHPQPCFGYRVKAEGKTYVHMTDHEFTKLSSDDLKKYTRFAQNADMLIADAQFDLSQAVIDYAEWGHSCILQYLELFYRSNIGRMVHYSLNPQVLDSHLDYQIEQARAYLAHLDPKSKMKIFGAVEGLTVQL